MKKLIAILSVVLFANQADALDISQYKKMNEIGKFLYLGGIAEALLVSYEFNRQRQDAHQSQAVFHVVHLVQ